MSPNQMQTTEYELRDRLDQLADYQGEGTELVTVAVPPDKSLQTIRERIDREYAQAANVKSDRTRTNVPDPRDPRVASQESR